MAWGFIDVDGTQSGTATLTVGPMWRSIETAPKDGTKIDVFVQTTIDRSQVTHPKSKWSQDSGERITNVWWNKKAWVRRIEEGDWSGEEDEVEHLKPGWYIQTKCTHWMPIPEPPA